MSDFAQSNIQTNYPSASSPSSYEPHSSGSATLPPLPVSMPSQIPISGGPHMPASAPISNAMVAPTGPAIPAGSAASTDPTMKTPSLQSNMFKMQRNRSNFFCFVILFFFFFIFINLFSP